MVVMAKNSGAVHRMHILRRERELLYKGGFNNVWAKLKESKYLKMYHHLSLHTCPLSKAEHQWVSCSGLGMQDLAHQAR